MMHFRMTHMPYSIREQLLSDMIFRLNCMTLWIIASVEKQEEDLHTMECTQSPIHQLLQKSIFTIIILKLVI